MIEKIAKMCWEILDTEEPLYWHYDLSGHDKDLTIDALLRAVLGCAERENGKFAVDGLSYVKEKFYSAYNIITNKGAYPY